MGVTRRKWSTVAFAVLVVVAVTGFVVTRQREKNTVTLTTARVERGTLTTTVSGTGVLQPLTTVEVKSNVGGQLTFLGVDEGDRVQAGQVIARIDPADAQSTLEQSLADLDSSRAKVTQARQSLTMQQEQQRAQLRSAEQAVTAARLKLAQAEKQATLQHTVTETSIEQARQTLASAQVRLQQAEAQATLQPQLTDTAIAQARSALAAAKAAYTQTKTSLVPQKIAAAQSALDQAKAGYVYAEKELTRVRQLQAKGFIARSEVDAAEQRFDVAKAQQTSAQQKMDTINAEARDDLEAAQAKVDQAEAAVKSAEANRTQDTLKQTDVTAARAAVKQAEAALKAAEANRMQDTLKNDEVTAARVAVQQAEAALEVAQANAHQTNIKEGDITQAAAQVKRSEAALTNARTELGYTTITAPRAGVVVKKYVETGSIVAGARTSMAGSGSGVTLLDLADVSRMSALVNIDETDIAQIRLGQEVEVTVDAFQDELFIGKVTKIAPQTSTEQNVTTIAVTVEVEAPDLRLKPGMNATCDFITARHSDVLLVPTTAVKRSRNGATVTVVEHGKPATRRVQLGAADNSNTEVRDGLTEGEQIVISTHDLRQQSTSTTSTSTSQRRRGPGGPPPF